MTTATDPAGAMDLGPVRAACQETGVELDETGGVGGGPVARPSTEASLGNLIALLTDRSQQSPIRLVPTGGGGQLRWCRPDAMLAPAGFLQLSMGSLLGDPSATGVVEYVPGDGTLTALAGADLGVLRATVAEGGHRLTPAIFGSCTLGGVLASGRSGLDRHSLGPTRHHLLGMRMIDGAGRHLRSGGRLVKNVTGFDLHRLHAGGRGIFGPIVEASMRLMPAPEAEQYLTSPPAASAAAAVELALAIRGATRIREQGLFVRDRVIHVLLSGRGRQVEADRQRLEGLVPGVEELAPGPGAEAFHLAGERQSAVRVSTVPSRIVGVVSTLEGSLGALSGAVIQPGVAQVDLPQALISGGSTWPSSLEGEVSVRGTVPEALRPSLTATVAPAGPESRWTRRLVEAFDPAGLFQTEGFPARS
jgi:glycolate oxidase FAD binding subunit